MQVAERLGVAGELSWAPPFSMEQSQGGAGNCCSELQRDHQITFWSALIRVRALPFLVPVAGLARAHDDVDEVSVFTKLTFPPVSPVTTTRSFSFSRAAIVVGADLPVSFGKHVQLVPAVRVFKFTPLPDEEFGDVAAGWTTRVSVGVLLQR